MSLLLNVIFASHARSTHHKVALDALRHLEGTGMERWVDLIICQHSSYLQGAKAPDDDFKDFKNHVLHVRDNFWGGAVASTHHWYGQLIDHLRGEEWKDAAYAAGVLSHYYTDPLMPFHTAQSEAEGAVHRAGEWSVTKSYDSLKTLIEQRPGGYPDVAVPRTADWLGEMVRDGAKLSNQYYELLIDHYNLAVGVKDPANGFDAVARDAIAVCLGHATIGLARILERAIEESAATPPDVKLTLPALLATINVPYRKIVNRLADSKDRQQVEAIFREVQETGKAIQSLPESERLVRQFHAAEVLKVPLSVLDREKPRPAGAKYVATTPPKSTPEPTPKPIPIQQPKSAKPALPEPEAPALSMPASPKLNGDSDSLPVDVPQPAASSVVASEVASQSHRPKPSDSASPRAPTNSKKSSKRFFLRLEAPIVDAPSIGPKTASRFHQVGMQTVAEFLTADPDLTATKLSTRHITASVLQDWQAQSTLMVSVPGLRGHDAQLLVAADVRDKDSLRDADPETLLQKVLQIADTSHGRSILRDSTAPNLEEVNEWIASATDVTDDELSPAESQSRDSRRTERLPSRE